MPHGRPAMQQRGEVEHRQRHRGPGAMATRPAGSDEPDRRQIGCTTPCRRRSNPASAAHASANTATLSASAGTSPSARQQRNRRQRRQIAPQARCERRERRADHREHQRHHHRASSRRRPCRACPRCSRRRAACRCRTGRRRAPPRRPPGNTKPRTGWPSTAPDASAGRNSSTATPSIRSCARTCALRPSRSSARKPALNPKPAR